MTTYVARVTRDGSTFTLSIRNGSGSALASHSGTAAQFNSLAMGLDVEAHEARQRRDLVRFIIPDSAGAKTGTKFELTPETTESLSEEIRRALVAAAGEIKLSRTASSLRLLLERTRPSIQ